MTDIAARLREVIEERLRVARAAGGDSWRVWVIQEDGWPTRIRVVSERMMSVALDEAGLLRLPQAEYVALNDPADAILAAERDLGVLERHGIREFGPSGAFGALCAACSITEGECVLRFVSWFDCPEIKAMAKRYAVTE